MENSMSAFSEFFMGSPSRVEQVQRFNPAQQGSIEQMRQLGMQGLQSGGTAGFDPIATQERQDFQRKTIPSIAERFASFGGGQQSSAFKQQLAQAGTDLDTRLAALRGQYGLQAMQNYQNMANTGLTPLAENVMLPGTPSALGQLATGAAEGIAKAYGGDWVGLALSGLKALTGRRDGGGGSSDGGAGTVASALAPAASVAQNVQQAKRNVGYQQQPGFSQPPVTPQSYMDQGSYKMPVGQLLNTMLSNTGRYAGVPNPGSLSTIPMPFLH